MAERREILMRIAEAEGPIREQNEDWVGAGASEALLLEQLAVATRELRAKEAEGGRTEEIHAVIRSLRRTLASLAERGAVQDLSKAEFSVRCPDSENLELWYRGRKLPAEGRLLRKTLRAAGVRLLPGQVLLADREWARHAIEESLVGLTLEEFRVREGKATLLRALHDVSPASTCLS
jgi:hypothetical protein